MKIQQFVSQLHFPGGGDLRTPPEDSPLWQTLSEKHEQPGFANEQVVVTDRTRKELASWPWNFDSLAEKTKAVIDTNQNLLRDSIKTIGYSVLTKSD